MNYTYKTEGTHAKEISFDIDGDIVSNIEFIGGCPGNTVGIAALADGMTVDKIERRLKGIVCANIPTDTSCPDQLAKAVRAAYEKETRK